MGKNKLKRFSEMANFPNVFQNHFGKDPKLIDYRGEVVKLKGKWNAEYFKNEHPITVELACGGGEYTVALAEMYPNRNFIGIDIKGARIYKGAKRAMEKGLSNVAFVRTRIEQLHLFFAKQEIKEFWITFPDPFLKEKKIKKRLTSSRFINDYRALTTPECIVNLKTDDTTLYDFTLETIVEEKCELIYKNNDIYAGELYMPELEFKTYYEHKHLEDKRKIKFIQFRLQ